MNRYFQTEFLRHCGGGGGMGIGAGGFLFLKTLVCI